MLFESILTDLIIIAGILCLSLCLESRLTSSSAESAESVVPSSSGQPLRPLDHSAAA